MAEQSRVKQVFIESLDITAAERASYLDQACGEDAELRGEVESLLAALARRPVFDTGSEPTVTPIVPGGALAERPGTQIGCYKLLQQIGEGGFGCVFMAEQERPIRRQVALKVIKLGMDTRQVIARFEQERQALALMDHPNIAKVLDAGTTDTGRPFFVMELVKGVPITEYCDGQRLTARERLELFVPICRAIQHAHQKGIIHRDIKPSNVLITLHDGMPVPKVIDFGVSKAMNQRLTEKTLFTEFRAILGTPAYMSPEQAAMSGLDVDTRTDVYSLGVLLYELLTGTTPFDVEELLHAGYAEMQRIIREVEPPKPSTRLSTMGATLPSIAAQHGVEPAQMSRIVRGDLDWIVMKCLEKDRRRRYETASGLAAEVEHYLAGEPVLAAPPSTAYRVRKFIRRNRVTVAAASAVVLALVLGVIGTTAGMIWAVREASAAKAQRDKSDQIAGFMDWMLKGVGPAVARGRDATLLREMLDSAAKKIVDGELAELPEAELHLRLTIGETYRNLAALDAAARMVDPAVELARKTFGAETEWMAAALQESTCLLTRQGKRKEALARAEETIALRRRLHPADHQYLANALGNLAFCLQELRRLPDALEAFEAALAMNERLHPGDAPVVAMSLNNLARCLQDLGRPAEALPKLEAALAMAQRLFPGDHPDVASGLNNVGYCLQALGRVPEAREKHEASLQMFRRIFDGDHPAVATALNNVASCLRRMGQLDEALEKYKESLEMFERLHKEDHPNMARALADAASCLLALNRPKEAEPLYARAFEILRRSGENHPVGLTYASGLVQCLEALGRHDDAIARLRDGLALAKVVLPPESMEISTHLALLAQALLKKGTPLLAAEAEPVLRECLAIRRRALPDGHPQVWLKHNAASLLGGSLATQAADTRLDTKRRLALLEEAEPLLIEAQAKLRDDPGVPPPAAAGGDRKREALERLVRLYEIWDQAEPEKGHGLKAEAWRTLLGT